LLPLVTASAWRAIGVCDGKLGFTNGRHRLLLAAACGRKTIPVVVTKPTLPSGNC
jgi:hypothetical protein